MLFIQSLTLFHLFSDYNECLVDNGRCEGICVNDIPGHHCECLPGSALQPDRRTCLSNVMCNESGDNCTCLLGFQRNDSAGTIGSSMSGHDSNTSDSDAMTVTCVGMITDITHNIPYPCHSILYTVFLLKIRRNLNNSNPVSPNSEK